MKSGASVARATAGRFHRPVVWLVLITAIVASTASEADAAAESAGSPGEISYVVRWQPTAPGMSASEGIGISLSFTAKAIQTTIDFPGQWALGLRDLHRHITGISVDGVARAASLDVPRLDLATRPGRRVTVEYRLSRRSVRAARTLQEALLPAATRDHVFIFGWAGLAIPDFFRCTRRACGKYGVRLRWEVPESWRVASDHGADAREFTVPAIDSNSWRDAFFVAGSTFHTRPLPGDSVLVFLTPARYSDIAGDLIDDAAQVAAVVEARWPGKRGERAVWLEQLAKRRSRTALTGVQVTSNIALFSDNLERNREQVLHTFVHEYLHGWIGSELFATHESSLEHYRWFSEGFVEYFTDVFMFRSGKRSFRDMVDSYNKRMQVLLRQPDPTVPLHAMTNQGSRRRLPLPYFRGYLLAYELAARLRERGRETLEQRVLRVVREGSKDRLSLPDLLAAMADGDADTARWLHAVLLGRKPLEVRATALGPCARPVRVPAPVAGLGFDPVWSAKLGQVVGLRAESAAAKAGLREGDELIGFSLDDIHSRGGAPYRLRVRRNGEGKVIVFNPDSGIERRTTRRFEIAVDDTSHSICGSPWN